MGIWIKRVAQSALDGVAQVIDTLNTSVNEHTNAPSIHAVKEALDVKWTDIYPIGSIYMNVSDVDPSELFGGTWERIKDTFLLSKGDTYATLGATGGEATHTLTTQEMPSHKHVVGQPTSADDISFENGANTAPAVGMNCVMNGETESAGGGQAHNNMPPYLVVNVWKRTA